MQAISYDTKVEPKVEPKLVEKRLLSTAEACRYLNLNRWALRKLVFKGELKVIRRPGIRGWLFDIRELDKWIEKNSLSRPIPRRW